MASRQLYTLANRLLVEHGTFVSAIKRVQSGFLPERNIKEAQEQLVIFQQMLAEMERALASPSPPKQPSTFIPMK